MINWRFATTKPTPNTPVLLMSKNFDPPEFISGSYSLDDIDQPWRDSTNHWLEPEWVTHWCYLSEII